jgi:hypothetical protein
VRCEYGQVAKDVVDGHDDGKNGVDCLTTVKEFVTWMGVEREAGSMNNERIH